MNGNKGNIRWYSAKWVTVLTMIIMPPIGLIFLWCSKTWDTGTKLAASIIPIIWFAAIIIPTSKISNTSSKQNSATDPVPQTIEERTQAVRDSIDNALQMVERERQYKADTERRQLEVEAQRAESARRANEEYDVDGLALVLKSMKATSGDYGGEITGIVINRRNKTLSYAQITFILYDNSGAQVGTALANISNLESGGRWKFKATTFGTDFTQYKFAELSGF